MTKPQAAVVRCAIYTRKSSEEGLEQDFNSLHAQREACEAYVRSQAGEGWIALPTAYDDGGFSGGSIERPALQQLLKDIEARRVDVVVVYKVDRLTRSLGDFARIVEIFDAAGASFVSVTQAFNTTTSMGRLTLNVLLSFAQFEREVTGERIRDKIAASKAKGLWMGGGVPLGYRPEGRTLKIDEAEAAVVRHIFARYLEIGSVHRLRLELAEQGYRSKRWTTANGKVRGGVEMNRGALFHLLSNRTYLGQVPHKGVWHPGQHPAIVDVETFEAVQRMLADHAGPKRRAAAGLEPLAPSAPLAGLIYDDNGDRLSPVSSRGRNGAVYRYYVPAAALTGRRRDAASRRLPAPALEAIVLDRLQALGLIGDEIGETAWKQARSMIERVEVAERQVRIAVAAEAWRRRRAVLDRIGAAAATDRIIEEPDRTLIICDAQVRRRGGAKTIVGPDGADAAGSSWLDTALIRALARAESWKRALVTGKAATIDAIAQQEGVQIGYAQRMLRLSFLAPDLKRSILEGRTPPGLTLQRLMAGGVADVWADQRRQAA